MKASSSYQDSYLDLIKRLDNDTDFVANKKNVNKLLSLMFSGVISYSIFSNSSVLVLCDKGNRFLLEPVFSGEEATIINISSFNCNESKKIIFWVKRSDIGRFIEYLNKNKQLREDFNGK